MDIERLSESERRLYELARAGTPLAEIGVRLGLPVPEVDRRLDLLVARLGLPDRLALRAQLPDPVMVAMQEPEEAPGTPATAPPHGGHRVSRRSLLIGGSAAIGLAAVGGAAAFLLAGDRSGDAPPGEPGTSPTPEPSASPAASGTPAPGTGLDLIEPISGAYGRRTFLSGDEIPWKHGIFFMDVDTGQVEGWCLSPTYAPADEEILFAYRLPSPRFIEMANTRDGTIRILVDRETGNAWAYPPSLLRLAVGQDIGAAGGRLQLLFEELDGASDRPAQPTGRYYVAAAEDLEQVVAAGDKLKRLATFSVPPLRFGPAPFLGLSSDVCAVASFDGQAYSIHLFHLPDGQERAVLKLPPPPHANVSVRWIGEAPAARVDWFGVEAVSYGDGPEVSVLRAWLPWSGDWPAAVAAEWDQPRSSFFDPLGSTELIQVSLRDVPAQALGGGESWPAVEIATRDGQVRARIRSASLFYGDASPHWRFIGDWFITMTASSETDGPGYERVSYTAWHSRTLDSVPLELPPPPGNRWYHRNQHRGPIPNPRNPGVVALGRFEVAHLELAGDRLTGRLTNHLVANVTSDSGADHLDQWAGNRDEMVFVVGHGGHDGGWPGTLLAPRVEQPPLSLRLRFVVARAADCLNLREAPSLASPVRACLPDGTELTLWETATNSGLEPNVASVRNQDGAWVAVVTPDGNTGWVSAAYLDWA